MSLAGSLLVAPTSGANKDHHDQPIHKPSSLTQRDFGDFEEFKLEHVNTVEQNLLQLRISGF